MNMIYLLSWMGLILTGSDAPATVQPVDSYGSANVVTILKVDETCTLFCDIDGFPPIIGRNMPVKICGLKTADAAEYNQKIQRFLVDLLLKEKEDRPKTIQLKNIQRGQTFCFLADIEIDGEDLCDLLVDNGLAQRIIEVKEPAAPSASASAAPTESRAPAARSQRNAYVASKTSKIFHRAGCAHAQRIDEGKLIHFSNRLEAMRTGRQPCKSCNP